MEQKLNLAYDLINAFTQWFMYHHLDLSDDIKIKMDNFFDYEVQNEN